jgi:hypothetical protein
MTGLLAFDLPELRWEYLAPAAIAALGLALVLYDRLRTWRQSIPPTPRNLFQELCAAHGLSRSERRVMEVVAETLPQGAKCRAFVDPRPLDHLAASGGPDGELSARLRKKLF